MIITGIREKKDENTAMEAKHFFRSKLRTDNDVPLTFAIRNGTGKNRTMLITLPYRNKKMAIFSKVSNLKDARNEDGK